MTVTPSPPAPVPVPGRRDVATTQAWTAVCAVEGLIPGRGVAALVDGSPVAVFWLGDDDVVALDDVDPFSGVAILSRGLVGDVGGEPTVASPLYKQRFALRSGRCLDDDAVDVRTWPARISAGVIEVGTG